MADIRKIEEQTLKLPPGSEKVEKVFQNEIAKLNARKTLAENKIAHISRLADLARKDAPG